MLEGNSSLVTKGHIKLSDINYPAITMCSKGSTKYALAERLGNYFDPKYELPDELLFLRSEFLMCAISLDMEKYFKKWKKATNSYNCLLKTETYEGCKARLFNRIALIFLFEIRLRSIRWPNWSTFLSF